MEVQQRLVASHRSELMFRFRVGGNRAHGEGIARP
jgi:hypothetical protein